MPKFHEAELDGITSEDLERAACLCAGQGAKADGCRSSILDGLDDHKRYIAKVDRERTASKARAQARAQEIAIDENLDPATRDGFSLLGPGATVGLG